MFALILTFVVGGLVGYFLGLRSAAEVAKESVPKDLKIAARKVDDIRVGDVREFEAEGYLIQAEVVSKGVRRGVDLVRYRMWRDDESPERALESESSAERFVRTYDRLVRRAVEEGKNQ